MSPLLPALVRQDGTAPEAARAILDTLPAMVDRARAALAAARSSAELLDASGTAALAYDIARGAARFGRAAAAHDALVSAAWRVQGDALLIEARAKIRLADAWDEAQARKEVGQPGTRTDLVRDSDEVPATAADVGLHRERIAQARRLRDAVGRDPGLVERTVAERLAASREPTRSAVERAAAAVLSFDTVEEADAWAKERRAEQQAEKIERRDAREAALGPATARAAARLGTRLYPVIYADPPWRFESWSAETGMDRAAENHYPTMALDAIKALQVPAAPHAALFLWVINPLLDAGIDVLRGWGFRYTSSLVWRKPRIGLGRWVRTRHEFLLIGTRGDVPAPNPADRPESVIDAPVGRHSEKPEDFARLIARIFPSAPKVELFARTRRPGWDAWGNEIPDDGAAAPPAAGADHRADGSHP